MMYHLCVALCAQHPKSDLLCHHIFDLICSLLPFTSLLSVTIILLPMSLSFCLCFSCLPIGCFQFYIPRRNEIIWVVTFSVWLISLSVMLSSSLHVATNGSISSSLWLSSTPLYICAASSLSSHA